MEREDILNQALALSPADRSYILHALERNLMEHADEQAFVTELDKRMEAYRQNPQSARPAADVLSELRQRQAQADS